MNTKETFSLKRLFNLIMIDLRSALQSIRVVTCILLFYAIFSFFGDFTLSNYLFILFTFGLIVTAQSFRDYHSPEKANLSLMLPCANLERLISRWFLTAIAYPLSTLIFSFLCSLPYHLMHPTYAFTFSLSNHHLWQSLEVYFVLQSIALLGAIHFRSQWFLKTLLLASTVLAIGFALVAIVGYLTFYPNHLFSAGQFVSTGLAIWDAGIWLLIAPFCWWITYLKITEYELNA